jgi:hypothetical protein
MNKQRSGKHFELKLILTLVSIEKFKGKPVLRKKIRKRINSKLMEK